MRMFEMEIVFFSFGNDIKKRNSSEFRMKHFFKFKKESFKLAVEIFLY